MSVMQTAIATRRRDGNKYYTVRVAVCLMIMATALAASGGLSGTNAVIIVGFCTVVVFARTWASFRLSPAFVLWITFAAVSLIAAFRAGGYPLVLLACIFFALFASGASGWAGVVPISMQVVALVYATITILMYVSPAVSGLVSSVGPLAAAYPGDYRSGLTTHYTLNGIILGFGLVSTVPLAILRGRSRLLGWVLCGVVLFALVLTTKRAHMVFGIVALLGTYVFIADRSSKMARRLVSAASIVAVAAVVMLPLATFVPAIGDAIDRFSELAGDDSYNGRRGFYLVAIDLFQSAPLFGHGWGSYNEAFMMTSQGAYFASIGYSSINAHNVYLQLLAEVGLIGLLVFLVAAGYTLVTSIRLARRLLWAGNTRRATPVVVSIGSQMFFLMYCMTGNPLYDLTPMLLYFVSVGVAGAFENDFGRGVLFESAGARNIDKHEQALSGVSTVNGGR